MTEAKFEVYKPDGSIAFSTANRALRLLSSTEVNQMSGSATVPDMHEGKVVVGSIGSNNAPPVTNVNTNTRQVDWSQAAPFNSSVYVMVY